MIAIARHVRHVDAPRRAWTPAPAPAPARPVTLEMPVVVLYPAQTLALRDQIARDQWKFFVEEFGVIAAYELTTPGYWRRRIRRSTRRFAKVTYALWVIAIHAVVAVAAVIVAAALVGPLLYALGVDL